MKNNTKSVKYRHFKSKVSRRPSEAPLQKPLSQFRRRKQALFVLAEPTVSVTGDISIHHLPQRPRYDYKDIQQRPGHSHLAENSQYRGRTNIVMSVLDKDHRVHLIRRQTALFEQLGANIGLQRSEPEFGTRVPFDNKSRKSLA